MDVSFQPKSTQPEDVKKGPTFADVVAMYKGERKSVLVIILTVTIFPILLAIGGVYVYKQTLQSQITQKEQELQAKDGQVPIKPAEMKEMINLSNRIKIVSDVIKGHPFLTTYFKLLEYSVEDDVVFRKTTIGANRSQGKELYSFDIEVQAKSYSSILNQMQTLRDKAPYNKFFSNVRMDSFGVGEKGEITFKLSGKASIQGPNMTAEDVERELLKILSQKEMPSREEINSALTPQPQGNATSSQVAP